MQVGVFEFFRAAPARVATVGFVSGVLITPMSVAVLVGIAFLQRFPSVIRERAQDDPLIDISLDHRPQLLQIIFFPEIAETLVGCAAT
jgi:hypothetical protein